MWSSLSGQTSQKCQSIYHANGRICRASLRSTKRAGRPVWPCRAISGSRSIQQVVLISFLLSFKSPNNNERSASVTRPANDVTFVGSQHSPLEPLVLMRADIGLNLPGVGVTLVDMSPLAGFILALIDVNDHSRLLLEPQVRLNRP